jgi:MFS family permease
VRAQNLTAAGRSDIVSHRKVLATLAAEGFLTRLGFGIVSFTLPLYALSIGMNVLDIGLLGTIRTVSVVTVKPVMGRLALRWGVKPVYLLAIAGRSLTGILFALSLTPVHLYVVRTLHGSAVAARDPAAATMLAKHARRDSLAASFAWYTTAKDVGGALGYSVAGFTIVLAHRNYRLPFLVAVVTSGLAWLLAARWLPGSIKPKREPPEAAPGPDVGGNQAGHRRERAGVVLKRSRGLLPISAFGAMVAGTAQMLYGFFPVLAVHYAHLSEAQTGAILTLSAVVLMVGGPAFGQLSDRVSRRLVLMLRALANAASSLVYLMAPSLGGIAAGRLLDDAGKSAFRPTWGALMASADGRARSPSEIADLDTAYSLGEAGGPLLAGWLWHSFGLAPMLLTRVALALATELYGWWVLPRMSAAPERRC